MIDIDSFIDRQLHYWTLAADNYRNLETVRQREIDADGAHFVLQFNPSRIRSTAAKISTADITKRPCFLCQHNRPQEQITIDWHGYDILVNPFPIFKKHLTIVSKTHENQTVLNYIDDMLRLAAEMPQMAIFFNGAKCGASAPDHRHFQAGNIDAWPLFDDFQRNSNLISSQNGLSIYETTGNFRKVYRIDIDNVNSADFVRAEILKLLEKYSRDESMHNLITTYISGIYSIYVIIRKAFRPTQYSAEGDAQILISPASAEVGGILITPREEDFLKISSSDIKNIFSQVCF